MYYYPTTSLAIIHLNDGKVLFKTDNVAIKIDGKSTSFLLENIFPLLDGENDLKFIATATNITEEELESSLSSLVGHGILRKSATPRSQNHKFKASPLFENFLDALGFSSNDSIEFLKQKKVSIVGLDGIGFQVIQLLQQYGVKQFNIADCSEFSTEDIFTYPLLSNEKNANTLQEATRDYLIRIYPELEINLISELNKESLREFVEDSDIIIGCHDKSFVASNYWINEISVELDIPAIYAEIIGQKCLVGPLVIPEKTPCYMCYKMRKISCAENFDEAMKYEEYLNNQKKSNLKKRSFLPTNLTLAASLLANEVIKALLSLDLPSLKGKLIEFDVFKLTFTKHNILLKPDCPVCQKKKEWIRDHQGRDELVESNKIEGDLSQYKDLLVSDTVGIVKYFGLFQKDISEPYLPYIIRADTANHNFAPNLEPGDLVSSGKGLTMKQAKISALGEAVERYSGSIYHGEEVHYTSYNKIDELKLDPAQLVLFLDHQYKDLEYSKFTKDTFMGWVQAYSLCNESKIYVPAVSVFMDYKLASNSEYLFPITSNGLGAGATLLQAIIAASMEVIERDAFIITWHQKMRCRRFDPMSLTDTEVTNYCKMYERRGVVLNLFELPTDFPCHVFMAVAEQVSGTGPALVVGLGADFDPHKAAKGALIEVGQVRPALRRRMRMPETKQKLKEILADPLEVKELEDHDLLYATPKAKHHFDFLLDLEPEEFDYEATNYSEAEKIDQLIQHTKNIGSDIIYYNLTPPDMEQLHLYTVRSIIPELQPIHFGTNKIRLGGKRLYTLPYSLGLSDHIKTYEQIDLQPHPLA